MFRMPSLPLHRGLGPILFLAYGILAATCTELYRDGETVPLYICENGFIALNPPLTENRIGSLSTRTTHPVVLSLLQEIVDRMGIRVSIHNPYATKTKGEMLVECLDQPVSATESSSGD